MDQNNIVQNKNRNITVTVKTFIKLKKVPISNECWSVQLSIHQRIQKKSFHKFIVYTYLLISKSAY